MQFCFFCFRRCQEFSTWVSNKTDVPRPQDLFLLGNAVKHKFQQSILEIVRALIYS